MKIAFVIPVRMNSSRLPGKCCLKIYKNFSLLDIIIARLSTFFPNIPIIVATSSKNHDDFIIHELSKYDLEIYRGSLNNVAERFVNLCPRFDYLIRINGDNAFLDKNYIQEALNFLELKKFKFISNVKIRSFPKGQSVEIINTTFFIKNFKNFKKNHLEHVFTYFYENWNPKIMKNIKNKGNLGHINLAIDDSTDFLKAVKYYESIDSLKKPFNLKKYDESTIFNS